VPAAKRKIYIEQGATFTLPFTWHQPGPVVNGKVTPGDPYDLTGWTARMQIRRQQKSKVLLAATSTGPDPKITIDGPAGRVVIKFSDDDTDLLVFSECLYDLEFESPTGEVYRMLEGVVEVSPNITQEADDPAVTEL
jgi:hypothetical protein